MKTTLLLVLMLTACGPDDQSASDPDAPATTLQEDNTKIGAKGDKGDQGEPGPQGPAGPAGKDGRDGTNGINGTNGTDGIDGTNGTDGLAGANGTNGSDGIDGAKGDKGDDGKDGQIVNDTMWYDPITRLYWTLSAPLPYPFPNTLDYCASTDWKTPSSAELQLATAHGLGAAAASYSTTYAWTGEIDAGSSTRMRHNFAVNAAQPSVLADKAGVFCVTKEAQGG